MLDAATISAITAPTAIPATHPAIRLPLLTATIKAASADSVSEPVGAVA
jgi:hypothetical protein